MKKSSLSNVDNRALFCEAFNIAFTPVINKEIKYPNDFKFRLLLTDRFKCGDYAHYSISLQSFDTMQRQFDTTCKDFYQRLETGILFRKLLKTLPQGRIYHSQRDVLYHHVLYIGTWEETRHFISLHHEHIQKISGEGCPPEKAPENIWATATPVARNTFYYGKYRFRLKFEKTTIAGKMVDQHVYPYMHQIDDKNQIKITDRYRAGNPIMLYIADEDVLFDIKMLIGEYIDQIHEVKTYDELSNK